jgi:hypothetical protein
MGQRPPPPSSPPRYPQPTEAAFARALLILSKGLPEHHGALASLLEQGRLHDVEAVVNVLEGRTP